MSIEETKKPERPAELDEGWLPWQVALLRTPTPAKLLHTRNQSGKDLQYIAGHDAIAMANGVFGVGNWSYSTGQVWQTGAVYHAVVTLQVRTPGGQIVERGDLGTCDIQGWQRAKENGRDPDINAVQQAAKGCVTDGLKRCLRTFGDFFGNSLYDDDAPVNHAPAAAAPRKAPRESVTSADTDFEALGSTRPASKAAREPDPDAGEARGCPTCDQPMVFRSGEKDGKKWSAWFCSAKCGQAPLWVR